MLVFKGVPAEIAQKEKIRETKKKENETKRNEPSFKNPNKTLKGFFLLIWHLYRRVLIRIWRLILKLDFYHFHIYKGNFTVD